MTTPELDQRSAGRRTRDEQIAAEPHLPPLELSPDAALSPMSAYDPPHASETPKPSDDSTKRSPVLAVIMVIGVVVGIPVLSYIAFGLFMWLLWMSEGILWD